MKNPYLFCLFKHASEALRTMLQMPYEGLSDVEHADFLLDALQSIHNSLQRSYQEFSLESKLQRAMTELRAAERIIVDCIDGYPPTKEKLNAALEILQMWTPKEEPKQ